MAQQYQAAPVKQKYRPAFVVSKIEGKRSVERFSFNAKGQKEKKTIEVDGGYFVSFAKGHSIRVANDEELQRLGFDKVIPLVNDEGDVVGEMPNTISSVIAATE